MLPSNPWPSVVVTALVIAAWLLGRASRPRLKQDRERSPATPRDPTEAAPGSDGAAATRPHDRDLLIDGIIDLRDRLDDHPLTQRIAEVLESVGVKTLDPVGEVFDPAKHTAQAPNETTSQSELDGRIAEVMMCGYADDGSVRRVPVVVVYQFTGTRE